MLTENNLSKHDAAYVLLVAINRVVQDFPLFRIIQHKILVQNSCKFLRNLLDVKLTTLDQNSTYAKILVQVSHQFNLSTQQVSCVQLDDNSDCSSLVIGYFVLANETSADVELSGLLAGGQYNITVGASHVSSTDVTFGSLVLCTG